MRITLVFDSLHPTEVYELTLAFQRTLGLFDPTSTSQKSPTVTVGGTAMGWQSPPITPAHAEKLLAEFRKEQADRSERAARGLPPYRYAGPPPVPAGDAATGS